MKIEVVEFYPTPIEKKAVKGKSRGLGTLHVYVADFDMDIRGIYVSQKGKHWFFGIPFKIGHEKDPKGRPVRYPIVSFANKATEQSFKKEIGRQGRAYIEEYLKAQRKG